MSRAVTESDLANDESISRTLGVTERAECDDFQSGKGVPSNYAMAPGGDGFTDNCGGGKKRYVRSPIRYFRCF